MPRKILVILILAVGIWAFFQKPSPLTQSFTQSFEEIRGRAATAPESPISTQSTPKTILEKKLHQEASLIGRVDANPNETEERLQNWAHSLNEQDLAELKMAALDTRHPQDDRFLAVMLMSLSEKAEALENLKDIALAEIDPYLNPNRMGDFERILRMQAVDGMLGLQTRAQNIATALQSVVAQTSDTTLADRANRALWSLRGDAPTPKAQDDKALKELLRAPKKTH